MASSISRQLRRYAVPSFFVSAYHFFRSRALISWSARVQFSRNISFGKRTVVKPFAVIQSSGGAVSFGLECAISSFDHFSTGEGDIVVGDYVRFAPNCTIVGGTKQVSDRSKLIVDQPEVHPNGVVIGDDVLVGANWRGQYREWRYSGIRNRRRRASQSYWISGMRIRISLIVGSAL
jgi:hypothetical protein